MLTEQQKLDFKDCENKEICEDCSMLKENGECVEVYYKNEIAILKDKLAKINEIAFKSKEDILSANERRLQMEEIWVLSLEVEK